MALESKKVRLSARQRAKFRIRKKVLGSEARPRLSVFKSCRHTYAQLICDTTGKTIAAASTLEKEVIDQISASSEQATAKSSKSTEAARVVGKLVAQRALTHEVKRIVYDRNGYVFHGRVKAVADGAREGGLDF